MKDTEIQEAVFDALDQALAEQLAKLNQPAPEGDK